MSWLDKIKDVEPKSLYSQYGEESYLQFIFSNIGVTNKYFVDIGANNGLFLSNTRKFKDAFQWKGLMIDGAHGNVHVMQHFITVENILEILDFYKVPNSFDLLSIDIDGNDYWILKEILTVYRPRVIISEYNAELPIDACCTIEYDPNHKFNVDDPDIYYGYSFQAGLKLAKENGYEVIHQNSALNMYYVRKELLPDEIPTVEYHQHDWWKKPTNKKWIQI